MFHSSWHSFDWTYAELFPSGKLFSTSNALKERTSLPQFFPENGGRHLHLKSLSWYNAMQLPPLKQGLSAQGAWEEKKTTDKFKMETEGTFEDSADCKLKYFAVKKKKVREIFNTKLFFYGTSN